MRFAQWLNPAFAIQVDDWVEELLTKGSVSLEEPKPEYLLSAYTHRLRYSSERIKLPPHYWCIFDEVSKLMGILETHLGEEIDRFDLIDGSVGIRWATYRKNRIEEGEDWSKPVRKYSHPFPDRRGTQEAKCYHIVELPAFRMWYQEKYCTQYLWQYLEEKYNFTQVKKLEAKYKRNQLVGAF